MSLEFVISCPRCLRQYAAEKAMAGQLGQCARCKAHFVISIATLSLEGEAVVFDKEVEPYINFFKEGCTEFVYQCCRLLRLAQERVTQTGVVMIARSIPYSSEQLSSESWRAEFCNTLLKAASVRCVEERYLLPGTYKYFLEYLPSKSSFALDMLVGAVDAILDSFDWPPADYSIAHTPAELERVPGPLERWAAMRGW